MSKTSLRYARALLLAIGEDAGKLEEAAANLDTAAEVLSEEKIREFFANPQISAEAKGNLIEKTFSKDKTITNLLKLVAQNRKIKEIKNIAESFRAVLSEAAGVATAKIESATPLNEKQIEDLTAALKKMTGKEVAIETSENKKLLGGVRIHLGDEMIDLSLAGKLGKLGKILS